MSRESPFLSVDLSGEGLGLECLAKSCSPTDSSYLCTLAFSGRTVIVPGDPETYLEVPVGGQGDRNGNKKSQRQNCSLYPRIFMSTLRQVIVQLYCKWTGIFELERSFRIISKMEKVTTERSDSGVTIVTFTP